MYSEAINTKEGFLTTEPMIMALFNIQHTMIKNLLGMIESIIANDNTNYLKNCDDRK
jgi:hypothetical protein